MSLVTTVRTELLARKGDWPFICRQAGVSYWWAIKFAQGQIKSPGAKNLEILQKYFETHPRAAAAASAGIAA